MLRSRREHGIRATVAAGEQSQRWKYLHYAMAANIVAKQQSALVVGDYNRPRRSRLPEGAYRILHQRELLIPCPDRRRWRGKYVAQQQCNRNCDTHARAAEPPP